jgi:hypothetical protein
LLSRPVKNIVAYSLFLLFISSCKPVTTKKTSEVSAENTNPNATKFFNYSEFENYFERLIKSEGLNEDQALEKIQRTLFSIVKRTFVVVSDEAGDSKKLKIFAELGEVANKNGNQIVLGGGAVRSLYGYLYEQIYTISQQNPNLQIKEILSAIENDKTEIHKNKVLGNGSDIDIYLKESKESDFLNLATFFKNQGVLELDNKEGDLAHFMNLQIDLKDYDTQLNLSTSQGGASINFLGIDLKSGRVLSPNGSDTEIRKLLHGVIDYLPPDSPENLIQPLATFLRAIRPLVEIPFLAISDETMQYAERAFNDLTIRLNNGYVPSEAELKQFKKIEENGRISAANNRLRKQGLQSNSIEYFYKKIVESIGVDSKIIKEFVPHFPIGLENRKLNGLPPELIINYDEFIANYTDNGLLYHGTPSLEGGFSIAQNSMYISSDDQGTAVKGKGGYSTYNRSIAKNYSDSSGIVLEFRIDPYYDKKLNILDWSLAKDNPFIKDIVNRARELNLDPYDLLSRDYGIDLIVSNEVDLSPTTKTRYVLIQNISPFKIVPEQSVNLNEIQKIIDNVEIPIETRMSLVADYNSIGKFRSATEGTNFIKIPDSQVVNLFNELNSKFLNADQSLQTNISKIILNVSTQYRFLFKEKLAEDLKLFDLKIGTYTRLLKAFEFNITLNEEDDGINLLKETMKNIADYSEKSQQIKDAISLSIINIASKNPDDLMEYILDEKVSSIGLFKILSVAQEKFNFLGDSQNVDTIMKYISKYELYDQEEFIYYMSENIHSEALARRWLIPLVESLPPASYSKRAISINLFKFYDYFSEGTIKAMLEKNDSSSDPLNNLKIISTKLKNPPQYVVEELSGLLQLEDENSERAVYIKKILENWNINRTNNLPIDSAKILTPESKEISNPSKISAGSATSSTNCSSAIKSAILLR